MKILWTYTPNLIDWLIHLVTGEDCGHLAIYFPSRAGTGVVFESNLLGCHPAFYKTWMGTKRRIIHELDVPATQEQQDAIWDRWVEKFDGRPYDFGGVFYLAWRHLLLRAFGTPLPARNRWAKRTAFFCDEVFQLIADTPGLPNITFRANGMATPHDVWLVLNGGRP